MPVVYIETHVQAPIERVFDLARSIDLHQVSAGKSNEKAVGGRMSGLINLNESVTWRAKHFGVYQYLTSSITEFDRPHQFTDEMVSGAFKAFRHRHLFEVLPDGGTRMVDWFDYSSPLGWLGKLADFLFLKAYMTRFLQQRNAIIKSCAESNQWESFLEEA